MTAENFNSHAHVERDIGGEYVITVDVISTHTLTWSVTSSTVYSSYPKNFNSHAHVERDHSMAILQQVCEISTHTLTWSVTTFSNSILPANTISTHTLTWSVTFAVLRLSKSRINFNSHAHVERDISCQKRFHFIFHFNSHAHVERDVMTFCLPCFSKFQLTRSRGA